MTIKTGTLEAFAKNVVTLFAIAERCIEEGDAASAARFAFLAGEKFERMRLKFEFERVAESGSKQARHLTGLREAKNNKAKASVAERRRAVAALMTETRLTGGALDQWLARQLVERCGIEVSARTIRGDRKALRG